MKKLAALFVAGLPAFTVTSVADGAGPERFTFEQRGDETIVGACGDGIDLTAHVDVTSAVKVFSNGDGNVARYVQRDHGSATWTRSDTGRSLSDPTRVTFTLEFDERGDLTTATVTGMWWNIVVPSDGAIFQVVGRTVRGSLDPLDEPLFLAGPKAFLEGQDLIQTLCDALA